MKVNAVPNHPYKVSLSYETNGEEESIIMRAERALMLLPKEIYIIEAPFLSAQMIEISSRSCLTLRLLRERIPFAARRRST